MIKAELIEKLAAENTHLTHAEVERLVNVVLGKMTDSLAEGGRVTAEEQAQVRRDLVAVSSFPDGQAKSAYLAKVDRFFERAGGP